MSTICIDGQDSLPAQTILVVPNRLDLAAAQELEKLLGGTNRVAWLADATQMPGEEMMNHLRSNRAAGIVLRPEQKTQEILVPLIQDMQNRGRHVILLPGPALQAPASLTDVPGSLLTLLDGSPLHTLPVYVGMYQANLQTPLCSAAPYDVLHLSICRPLRAGAHMGARIQAIWMSAQAEQLGRHPMVSEANLPRLLAESLMQHPESCLLDGVDDSTLPYGDILAAALMLRESLSSQTTNGRLGIILPPGKLLTIAFVACQLAGIAPVFIGTHCTAAQLENLSAQAGITRFITEERYVSKEKDFEWPPSRDLLFLEKKLAELGSARLKLWRAGMRINMLRKLLDGAKLPTPRPDDTAAIICTAGTESGPLAVPLTHRMLVAGVLSLQSRIRLEAGDSCLCSMPPHSAAGLLHNLLLPLLIGARPVTYPTPTAGRRLCTLIRQYGTRLVTMHPEQLPALLRSAPAGCFAAVTHFFTCGAKLPPALAETAWQKHHLQLLESYGTAEVLPAATANLPAQNLVAAEGNPAITLPTHRPGTVGLPLPGVAVRITGMYRSDPARDAFSPGLIWLKGPGVTSCYVAIANGDTPRMQGQWFCTGDVGMMSPDGMLTILGRRDRFTQVENDLVPHEQLEERIHRIYNINPAAEPARKLAIVSIPGRSGGEELVLLSTLHKVVTASDYLTLRYGITNMRLPGTWAPRHILPVPRIPLLPDGQLDYRRCRDGACQLLRVPARS